MGKLPVFTRLSGGLGNQIYGICASWLIAQASKRKILLEDVFIDNPQYSNRIFNLFEIDFTKTVEDKILVNRLRSIYRFFLRYLSKAVRRGWIPGEVKFDDNSEFSLRLSLFCTQIHCDSRIAAKARMLGFPKKVNLKNPSLEYNVLESEALNARILAVHLRLTDIRTFESGNRMLSPNYFERNIHLILNRHSIDEVWVFSDEPNAVSDFLPESTKLRNISSYGLLTPCEELVLMTRCAALLGSRSTFSFWAGFWNSNQDSIYYPGPVVGFPRWHNSLL